MPFHTLAFGLFFVVVFALHWLLRGRVRAQNAVLLVASLVSYAAWDVRFLYLLLLVLTVHFYCALMIGPGVVRRSERWIASLALIAAAFLCVTVDWRAVAAARDGLRLRASVDWGALLPPPGRRWLALAATVAGVALVQVLHPRLARLSEGLRRRGFLVAGVTATLLVLGSFKYFDFFSVSLARLAHGVLGVELDPWTLRLVLPVGISFYTFQSLAYTLDVHRRTFEPVERYVPLVTRLSFFPLLVSGPIERAGTLFPQFARRRVLDRAALREGLWLVAWGLYKKLVVADNLKFVANAVFEPFDRGTALAVPHDGLRLLIGVWAFALQLYGDFSGYSDMARGTARLLGFDVRLNFNLPHFAASPSDFWQRWHISLASWLRDYVHLPTAFAVSRRIRPERVLGVKAELWAYSIGSLVTMVLCGLWHGAAWTFVLWGAYHGFLLVIYRAAAPRLGSAARRPALARAVAGLRADALARLGRPAVLGVAAGAAPALAAPARDPRPKPRLRPLLAHALAVAAMSQLVCLGWLLFRARDLATVGVFLASIVGHPFGSAATRAAAGTLLFHGWFLLLFQALQAASGTLDPMPRWHWLARLSVWLFVLLSLLTFGTHGRQEFLYLAF